MPDPTRTLPPGAVQPAGPRPDLTCNHVFKQEFRPPIGPLPPSVRVYCTLDCGFEAVGPNEPMAWLTAGAKVAGDRSAMEVVQLRTLLGTVLDIYEQAQGDESFSPTEEEQGQLAVADEAAIRRV